MKVHTSETAVLVVFAVTLIGCILAGIPILAALALGYLIFFAYTLNRGYTVRDIFGMSWKGIKTAKNILITFLLIGMLTALWRAAGTIPAYRLLLCRAYESVGNDFDGIPFKLSGVRPYRNSIRNGGNHGRDLHDHGEGDGVQ
ncbi:MAG: hypothetical protein ACLR78_03050 [Roseburia sp.]